MNVALLSLLGVAIGASLQFIFTRVLEERRHARELKARAYSDYIEAVAGAKHRSGGAGSGGLERLTNAKVRIGLHGSRAAVQKLAAFERLGGHLNSSAQISAFVALLGEMRGDSGLTEELRGIVFGVDHDEAASPNG